MLFRSMVTRFGMSEELGTMVYEDADQDSYFGRMSAKTVSEATQQKVDAEIRKILDHQYELSRHLLETNRDKVEAMAKAGQIKQQKKSLQVDAMAKAGDLRNKRHQLGAQFINQGAQQKHEAQQKHKDIGAQIVQQAMQQQAQAQQANQQDKET